MAPRPGGTVNPPSPGENPGGDPIRLEALSKDQMDDLLRQAGVLEEPKVKEGWDFGGNKKFPSFEEK